MGHVPKSQSIDVQNLTNTPFNNIKMAWKKYVQHGGAHMAKVESAYIPHEQVLEFFESERDHIKLAVE
jgi:hypothetical protein